MKKQYLLLIIISGLLTFLSACKNESAYKTLIITGQNNHDWKTSSPILKQILDETGLFSSEIMITPEKDGDMNTFDPDFSKYKLVVLDYNGDSWSEKTNSAFLDFVKNGGGVIIYHAANNSFPGWQEYNEMIGLGGWGDRNEKDGPYIYYKDNELVVDTSAGPGGTHGERRESDRKTPFEISELEIDGRAIAPGRDHEKKDEERDQDRLRELGDGDSSGRSGRQREDPQPVIAEGPRHQERQGSGEAGEEDQPVRFPPGEMAGGHRRGEKHDARRHADRPLGAFGHERRKRRADREHRETGEKKE